MHHALSSMDAQLARAYRQSGRLSRDVSARRPSTPVKNTGQRHEVSDVADGGLCPSCAARSCFHRAGDLETASATRSRGRAPEPGLPAQVIATGPTIRASAMPETFVTLIGSANMDRRSFDLN